MLHLQKTIILNPYYLLHVDGMEYIDSNCLLHFSYLLISKNLRVRALPNNFSLELEKFRKQV